MKHRFFLLTIFALVLAATPAVAEQMKSFSVEQLTQQSQIILRGTVARRTVQRDPEGRIYTKVELRVTEVWKGSVEGDRFVLVHGGGVLGEEATVISGQESYEVGEEVAAFLVLNQRGEGVTLGLAQGKFHVSTDPASGEKFAHNLFHGRPPDAKIDPARRGAQKPPLDLRELKRRVQGGRP